MFGLFFGLILNSAVAETNFNIVPNYECQLILVVDEPTEQIHEKFLSDYSSGMHGGSERVFEKGSQRVTVMASNNWMAIQWEKDKELVTVGHFVISKPSDFSRVIQLLNPKNLNELVSLDCHPEAE